MTQQSEITTADKVAARHNELTAASDEQFSYLGVILKAGDANASWRNTVRAQGQVFGVPTEIHFDDGSYVSVGLVARAGERQHYRLTAYRGYGRSA